MATLLVFRTMSDIVRYVRIKRIATHPEAVPADGNKACPQTRQDAAPDGTGDVDSALRGGPHLGQAMAALRP